MSDWLTGLQAVMAVLSIMNMFGLWAVAIYTWQANRRRVTEDRINELQDDMNESMDTLKNQMRLHGDRLTKVEGELQHAPTHEDIKRLHIRVDAVNGSICRLEGEFKSANKTLGLIHQYLLEKK